MPVILLDVAKGAKIQGCVCFSNPTSKHDQHHPGLGVVLLRRCWVLGVPLVSPSWQEVAPATLVGDVPVATSIPSGTTMLTVVGFAFASPHIDGSVDISIIAHPIIVGV